MSGVSVQSLGVESIGFGLIITCLCLILSMTLKLHLSSKFMVAITRMILQLSCLGYILVPIFNHPSWELSLLISSIMTVIAAWEGYGQARFRYNGLFFHTWLAIALSMFACLILVLWLCIPIRPFYTPQVRVMYSLYGCGNKEDLFLYRRKSSVPPVHFRCSSSDLEIIFINFLISLLLLAISILCHWVACSLVIHCR